MLGVVRGLCADFPWGPPFRTEARPHWCPTLPISSYQCIAIILAPPVTLYYVVERSTGFLGENIPRYVRTFLEYFQDIPRTCPGHFQSFAEHFQEILGHSWDISRNMSRTFPKTSRTFRGHFQDMSGIQICRVMRRVICITLGCITLEGYAELYLTYFSIRHSTFYVNKFPHSLVFVLNIAKL